MPRTWRSGRSRRPRERRGAHRPAAGRHGRAASARRRASSAADGTTASLAREVYWAGDGVSRVPADVGSLRERLDAFAHQLRIEQRQLVPIGETLLGSAVGWRRRTKLSVWRLTRFSTMRYDRLLGGPRRDERRARTASPRDGGGGRTPARGARRPRGRSLDEGRRPPSADRVQPRRCGAPRGVPRASASASPATKPSR